MASAETSVGAKRKVVVDDEDSDEEVLDDNRIITTDPKDRVRLQFACFTHFLHDDCDQFPCECVGISLRKGGNTYNVLGGGYEVETCPKTKKKHHQGWVAFDQEVIFAQLKKMFCQKVHWAKMNGTVQQNITYCSKEKNYVAFGDQETENTHIRAGKGQRNDLAAVAAASESGMKVAEIARKYPIEFIKFAKGIQLHHGYVQRKYEEAERRFIILWGESGSGKSWGARRIIGDDSYYIPESNNQSHLSFETYDGEQWILMEEFNGLGLYYDELKKITDRFPVVMRGRGSSKEGLHIGVVVTSNVDPQFWFPKASEEDQVAMCRRAEHVYQCNRDKWLDQLEEDGVPFANPCPYVSQQKTLRSFAQLPRLTASSNSATSSSSFLLNNKAAKFSKHFPAQ